MSTTGNAGESSDSTNPSSESQPDEPIGLITHEKEPASEQLPAVITLVRYLVFSIPCGDPPKVLHAFNDKDVCKVIRDLHNQNDQQYMFIVRNGELGRLYRTERGFVLRFKEAGLKLKIPFHNRLGPLSDNWIGD